MAYVPTGFSGGSLLGRVLLIEPTYRFGERRMVTLYALICLALQLVFWLEPSIVADVVVFSLMGFFFGPFFPTVSFPNTLPTGSRLTTIRASRWHRSSSLRTCEAPPLVSPGYNVRSAYANVSRFSLRTVSSWRGDFPIPHWNHCSREGSSSATTNTCWLILRDFDQLGTSS